MCWSKIEDKTPKPIGWWYCKIICEFGWFLRNNINYRIGDRIYFKYLKKCVDDYHINIYGVRLGG